MAKLKTALKRFTFFRDHRVTGIEIVVYENGTAHHRIVQMSDYLTSAAD